MSGAGTPNLTSAPASGSSTPVAQHAPSSSSKASLPAAFQQPVASSSAPLSAAEEKKKKGGVFSSDGSFIERFRKLREDELERLKAEEARTKAQSQQDRIRNRGRKRAPPVDASSTTEADQKQQKKRTAENVEAENEYLKELKKLKAGEMRDQGSGVKPLMH